MGAALPGRASELTVAETPSASGSGRELLVNSNTGLAATSHPGQTGGTANADLAARAGGVLHEVYSIYGPNYVAGTPSRNKRWTMVKALALPSSSQ